MLCLFLLVLLAAMSLPELRTALDRAALRQAVTSTEQLMSEAVVRAAASGSPTTLVLNTLETGELHWRLRQGEASQQLHPLPERVSAQSARFGAELEAAETVAAAGETTTLATVTYYPTGAATPGTLLLVAGSQRCRIVQPLRGAAHVEWLE